MKYIAVSSLLLLLPFTAMRAAAQAEPDTAELRAEIDALRERLDAIDTQGPTISRISLSGDLRYRHETINADAAATERSRHRIRARLGLSAPLGDDLSVGIRLSTGGSNPVSANQTLDGGFTGKDIRFDRAFFAWNARDDVTLRGGKMGNPLFRPGGSQLLFDNDLNPEGLALSYSGESVFANLGGFWADERSGGDDAILYALQGGYETAIADGIDLVVGASYLDYSNTRGFEPFYLGEPQGNTVDAQGNLANDYDLLELFVEAALEAGGRPLELYLDYVENTKADSRETGYVVGVSWGGASDPGDWELSWSYGDLEADAAIATFTDSNFIGGGTDGKGHIVRGAYRLRDNVRLNGAYFFNEQGAKARPDGDYKRLQLDISFLF